MYWIEILKDYFDKLNPEDFKRFCEIILILFDFKKLFVMTFYNQDFEHMILMDFKRFFVMAFYNQDFEHMILLIYNTDFEHMILMDL